MGKTILAGISAILFIHSVAFGGDTGKLPLDDGEGRSLPERVSDFYHAVIFGEMIAAWHMRDGARAHEELDFAYNMFLLPTRAVALKFPNLNDITVKYEHKTIAITFVTIQISQWANLGNGKAYVLSARTICHGMKWIRKENGAWYWSRIYIEKNRECD